jgi:hypothetical protein
MRLLTLLRLARRVAMPFNSDPMIRAKKLLEGMWQGDLNDLVLNTISIDEYDSKVDEKAIVIGFFVHDIDAANDLNRFIQKSTIDILYAEVSPAPDQRGYYIVFVEFLRNKQLVENICELVAEVTFLTNVEEWSATVYGTDSDDIKITPETLAKALGQAHVADIKQGKEERHEREVELISRVSQLKKKLQDAQKKLRESSLDDIKIANGNILLTSRNKTSEFDVEQVDDISALDSEPFSMDFNTLRECREFAMNMGEGWDVAKQGKSFVLNRLDSDFFIKLRPTG